MIRRMMAVLVGLGVTILIGCTAQLDSRPVEPGRTVVSVTPSDPPTAKPATPLARIPQAQAESNGWALISINTRRISDDLWGGNARIRNASNEVNAIITITYIDGSGSATHVFQGAASSVPKGKTTTVTLTATGCIGTPSGKPDLDAQAF